MSSVRIASVSLNDIELVCDWEKHLPDTDQSGYVVKRIEKPAKNRAYAREYECRQYKRLSSALRNLTERVRKSEK